MNSTTTRKQKIDRAKAKVGDVFSEESHYIRLGAGRFRHLESGDEVSISDGYMELYFDSADQSSKTVEVGKEDKYWSESQIKKGEAPAGTRAGDIRQKGIRSIWSDIHSGKVFTVNFNKQGKEMSDSALEKAKEKQLENAVDIIETAYANKKGVRKAALEAIQAIMDNPIEPVSKGEERTLRGYKTQFTSITGFYNVIDMDINEQRQVNVNTINWLVVDGVKYIVK